VRDRETEISWAIAELRNAKVDILLRELPGADPAATAGPDSAACAATPPASATVPVSLPGRPDGTGTTAEARIDCCFEIFASAGEPALQLFALDFPVTRVDDPPVTVTAFSVLINGEPASRTKWLDRMSLFPNGPLYRGYQWPILLPIARPVVVDVRYTVRLDLTYGLTFFRYVLSSGAAWSRPLGWERVTVHCDDRLRALPVAASTLHPDVRGDSLSWTLHEARPAEDIVLCVLTR
jgi:hypothetical protein